MNLPTMQQAIESANKLMGSDKSIVSVEIEFVTEAGYRMVAEWNGEIKNVRLGK